MSVLNGLIPMRGRDTSEDHRAATSLELLFDLTFVVAFSIASSQFAHELAMGRVGAGLLALGLALFSIMWCWINYSWFASAFDNDDWGVRLLTLLQMVGVLVLAVGLPTMFAGINHGVVNTRVMVSGYVLMRVSMIALWWRVYVANPQYRAIARWYMATLAVAQIGWLAFAFLDLPLVATGVIFTALFALELGGVAWAELRRGPSPWHPHHIAERYGLLVIITLGEVILGTTTAISSLVEQTGWTLDALVVAAAGVGLAAGMWWTYFGIPHGHLLERKPHIAFPWGYGHMLLYAAVVATGAGLHVAALALEGKSTMSRAGSVAAIAVPVGGFMLATFALHARVGRWSRTHVVLAVAVISLLIGAVVLAGLGVAFAWCLVVVVASPWLAVAVYESRVGARLREACMA